MSVQFDVRQANPSVVDLLEQQLGLPRFIATTLASRGVTTPEQAERFFSPSLDRDWANPYNIPGMENVVDELEQAIRRGDHIVVFGDFDVDGISATTVLTRALRQMGALATPFIPRRFDEGYGLTEAAFQRVMQLGPTPDFIVTVDCGISCRETVAQAVGQGLRVVVTDPHEPADAVPVDVPSVDPKRAGSKEDAVLAGVGVALKVVQALGARFGMPHLWREYTDLATLGTVADLMPMIGANRALVADGLCRINENPRPCIAALLAQAGATDKTTSTNLSFSAVPRLNAAGRMGDSSSALELLMCDDPARCQHLAAQLEEINTQRRSIESELTEIAKVQAEEIYHGQRALVVAGAGWHEGVKGIVASRLVGTYGVPTILLTIDGDEARGSGRSVGRVNLFKAIESCADLLTRYGGHEAAVGVTLPVANLEEFTRRLCAFMDELPPSAFHPAIPVDARVSLAELTLENVRKLDLLAPFGQENPVPCFMAPNVTLANHRAVGAGKNHFSCNLSDGTGQTAAIMFHCSDIETLLDTNSVVNAAFTLQIDSWRGRESVKAMLKTVSPARSCAALEACLSPEEVSFVADLYASAEDGVEDVVDESFEEIERYESMLAQNRADWRRFAQEAPDELQERIIQTIIGAAELHDSQRQILDKLAQGQSLLAVMATGRGKSLTFQVRAAELALEQGKASIFVYPLRALIADQAWHLNNALLPFGVSSVTLTGESTPQERAVAFAGLTSGDVDIVLTTPEFLVYHAEEFAACQRIGFVAIDEAHHVGQAKAGNRMAYRSLGTVLKQLGDPTVLALTATAPDAVARDVAQVLSLRDHVYDQASRENLQVDDHRNLKNRDDYLAHIVARGEKTVVYVSSREQSVAVARSLRARVPQLASRIGFYNAGLSRVERNRAEELFRTDAFCVLVATSAFGEGVNIPHIRRVVLYGLPFNEIEFNQMSGRAGRDGDPAIIHLLYGNADAQTNKAVVCGETPDRAALVDVYKYLRSEQVKHGEEPFMVNLDDFASASGEAPVRPADDGVAAGGAAAGVRSVAGGASAGGVSAAGGVSCGCASSAQVAAERARAQAAAAAQVQAASAAASKLSAAAVKCGIAVFRELGFIEARPGCFCGERIWAIRVKHRPEKVDLMESVRFREGLGEIEESRSFGDWALSASADELLAHIVYPIIPNS